MVREHAAQGYRLGIDIGGTFTDIVAARRRRLDPTRRSSSTPDDYARGIVDGARRAAREHGVAPADDRRGRARHDGRDERRSSKAGARAPRSMTTDGLPRRARAAAPAHPRALRPPLREAGAARAAPAAASRSSERIGPRGERAGAAGRGERARRGAQIAARRASRRSRSALLHAYANARTSGGSARSCASALGDGVYVTCSSRDPAGDPRVRAHQHGGRQRLRRPGVARYLGSLVDAAARARHRRAARRSCSRAAASLTARRRARSRPA